MFLWLLRSSSTPASNTISSCLPFCLLKPWFITCDKSFQSEAMSAECIGSENGNRFTTGKSSVRKFCLWTTTLSVFLFSLFQLYLVAFAFGEFQGCVMLLSNFEILLLWLVSAGHQWLPAMQKQLGWVNQALVNPCPAQGAQPAPKSRSGPTLSGHVPGSPPTTPNQPQTPRLPGAGKCPFWLNATTKRVSHVSQLPFLKRFRFVFAFSDVYS